MKKHSNFPANVIWFFSACFVTAFFSLSVAQPSRIASLNLSAFSENRKAADRPSITQDQALRDHPDYGILPVHAPPCVDCYEELVQRSQNHRSFIQESESGTMHFEQYAAGAINYKDEKGYWREIDSRLHPAGNSRFIADHQPFPVEIDLNNHSTALVVGKNTYIFNKEISLWYQSDDGRLTSLGECNWTTHTAGDQGVMIRDVYPGIDLVFQVREATIESGFLIRHQLPFSTGKLVLKMGVELPDGARIVSGSIAGASGAFIVADGAMPVCQLKKCFAFDDNTTSDFIPLDAAFHDNQFSITVPLSWLNDKARKYPVLIDPVVTTQGILNNSPGGVEGTRYSPVCWTNGCDYSLTVPTPANARLSKVYSSFEYYAATGVCQARDGGYSISLNGCTAPAASPGVFTCASASTNYYCGSSNMDITTDLSTCLPPDQCAPQNLDFILHFYRCNNSPDTGCSATCISASQPWIITVESRELELPFITPSQQICSGQTTDVVVVAQEGIGPYSYAWSPPICNTDTLTVSPLVTSSYSVTVTDQCGVIRTAGTTINVQTIINPGFSVSTPFTCTNSPVTLTGNGGFPATAYDWVVPGSNAASGIINNTVSPVIQYSLPGVYPITLRFQSGGCTIDSVVSLTVMNPSPAVVNLTANPSGVLCPGATTLFSASSGNGGSSPQYSFFQNGALLQSGNATTIQMTNLQNGDVIQVVMTSNASCVSPLIDTASLFIAVSGLAVPEVLLTASPSLCQGVPVTLNAIPVNGGTTPTYQWLINGAVVSGATGSSFGFTPGLNDTSIGVIMTSSQSCVSSTTADDQLTIGPAAPAAVTLQSATGGGICSGQPLTVTALPVNGGAAPAYTWYLNGQSTGDTGHVFTSGALVSGDILTVLLLSSSACAIPSTAVSLPLAIQVFPPLSALVFGAPPVCEGLPVTLAVAATGGDGGPYAYEWNGISGTDASFSFTPASNQYVTITIHDGCGSDPVTDSAYIIVKPLPQSGFTFAPATPTTSNPAVQFVDQSLNASSVLWMFGDGDSSNLRSPLHAYALPGTYTVTQISLSANGCADTMMYQLVVEDGSVVYFPNAFTPNGDLVNDLWLPVVPSNSDFDYYVYDRWGHNIFEGNSTTPWDGTFKGSGKQVPPGVYTYLFKFNPEKNNSKGLNGRITLLR